MSKTARVTVHPGSIREDGEASGILTTGDCCSKRSKLELNSDVGAHQRADEGTPVDSKFSLETTANQRSACALPARENTSMRQHSRVHSNHH